MTHVNGNFIILLISLDSKNTNNDSNLNAEECGQEYGADNLMFWDAWDNGNQDNLTAGQIYVLKRALIAK